MKKGGNIYIVTFCRPGSYIKVAFQCQPDVNIDMETYKDEAKWATHEENNKNRIKLSNSYLQIWTLQ